MRLRMFTPRQAGENAKHSICRSPPQGWLNNVSRFNFLRAVRWRQGHALGPGPPGHSPRRCNSQVSMEGHLAIPGQKLLMVSGRERARRSEHWDGSRSSASQPRPLSRGGRHRGQYQQVHRSHGCECGRLPWTNENYVEQRTRCSNRVSSRGMPIGSQSIHC